MNLIRTVTALLTAALFFIVDLFQLSSSFSLHNDIDASQSYEGCSDQRQAWPVTRDVVACFGSWTGHVQMAMNLCGQDFQVCSYRDKARLRQIHWSVASATVEGCFAFNAAHNEAGGKCDSCNENQANQVMAALGRDCPQKVFGQGACLLEGRIALEQSGSCHFKPNVTTGVLCCRQTEDEPHEPQSDGVGPAISHSILAPVVQMVRSVGEKAVLQCPLSQGSSQQLSEMVWTKDGHVLAHVTIDSWTVEFSRPEDSGLYACRQNRQNVIGIGHVNLTVNTVRSFGCKDGTSEGFHYAHDVQGCAGHWQGHIKGATKQLCANGWRVCNPGDKPFLDQIDPVYLREFGGCFAFNAGFVKGKCKRCRMGAQLAAIGGDCPMAERQSAKTPPSQQQRSEDFCFDHKAYVAYSPKQLNTQLKGQPSCAFQPYSGVTGVLCCRKPHTKPANRNTLRLDGQHRHRHTGGGSGTIDLELSAEGEGCFPGCRNGGTCLTGGPNGRCLCPPGYFGHSCQHGGCALRCLNGGRCFYGFCKCYSPFYGSHCQFSKVTEVQLNKQQPIITSV